MLDPLQDASLQPQQRLRANRQLRYASSPIRAIVPVQRTGEQHQDMEICNPCSPTFLLPISPAGQCISRSVHVVCTAILSVAIVRLARVLRASPESPLELRYRNTGNVYCRIPIVPGRLNLTLSY